MATLPLGLQNVLTPFRLAPEGRADVIITGANNTSLADKKGWLFRGLIRPFPMRADIDADRAEEVITFLESEGVFEFPVPNMVKNEATGVLQARAASVNEDTIDIDYSGGLSLKRGQHIRVGSKTKVYKIAEEVSRVGNTSTFRLTHGLRQNVTAGDAVTYTGDDDGAGQPFDGVLGTFINENFADPVGRYERGIL